MGQYTGPKPTYCLRFDWTNEDHDPVEVGNKAAMERCFGARGGRDVSYGSEAKAITCPWYWRILGKNTYE